MNQIILQNIKTDLNAALITDAQALFLIYKAMNSFIFIEEEALGDLIEKKYLKGNNVTAKITSFRKKDKDITGTIIPNYALPLSQDVTKKLCRMFCVTDNKGNLSMPGGATPEELIKYTADKYLRKEQLVAYYYIIMLFMFPVAGNPNKRWEKHFTGKRYKGPRLRLRALAHGKLFLKIAKEKDIGVFLYAVYLYMKESTKGGTPYITTITKFLYDYDDWYFEAKDKINNAKNVASLFKTDANVHNMVILTDDD